MKNHVGIIYAFSAYLWWGLVPLFWKQIDHVPALEIVMHRMVWACLIVFLLIVAMRQWRSFCSVFGDRKMLLRLLLASVLITANWAIYIWAVNNEHIVETSLGYFINPLITVLFGLFFFGEALRKIQVLALLLAAIGVAVMVVATGGVPLISLSLAVSFALYSVIKKKVRLPATHGLAIETMFSLLPAVVYLMYLSSQGRSSFGTDFGVSVMLVLGGFVTLAPLLMFAAAAKKVSMTTLGMTQYIGPSCQLVIGVMVYQEPFGLTKLLAFGFIWLALIVYSADQLYGQRQRRLARARV